MSLSRIVLHLFNNLLQNIIAPEPGGFINNLLISLSFRVFIPAVEVADEQLEQVTERDDAGDAAVLVADDGQLFPQAAHPLEQYVGLDAVRDEVRGLDALLERGLRERWSQRRDYKFFRCPSCRTLLRVPKGKGKIKVVCRKCGNSFIKKT